MVNIVYMGNDGRIKSALGFLPGYSVRMARTYKEVEAACRSFAAESHTLVFVERHSKQEDITAISYLKMNVPGTYIILISPALQTDERAAYLSCGVNDTISDAASISEIHEKVTFVDEHAEQLFADVIVQKRLF